MAKLNTGKLLEELSAKWNGRACPLCGKGSWIASEKIFELREYNDGDLVLGGGPITPVVPITCDNCGNTVLVNPLVLKIVED
jgi:ribosomal protein S27AE